MCVCVFPFQVQLSLYTYLSAEFIGTATIYNTIRRVGTVLQLMHTLKYYYWAINPADCSGITPKGLGEHILAFWICFSIRQSIRAFLFCFGTLFDLFWFSVYKLLSIRLKAHPSQSSVFWRENHREWTNHNQCVQSQAWYQSVFVKWQQLPHIWNDSSPHGSSCLSAVRTVAISGDDSEADTSHQYCHPPMVLGVGVRPLKPGPVVWLASSLYETTVRHQADCAGKWKCPWTIISL